MTFLEHSFLFARDSMCISSIALSAQDVSRSNRHNIFNWLKDKPQLAESKSAYA
jgi:hypothetical protein